jgi:hypothetical protein
MLDLLKCETFWTALGAVATLVGAGAILFAAKQLRFDAWLKAQDIWASEEFLVARRKIFARIDVPEAHWKPEDKALGLDVCRRMDEFVRLAPYLRKRKMLAVWGDPLAKAWVILKPIVDEEREATTWPTKWDAFEKFGRKALNARPDIQTRHQVRP